MIVNDLDIRRSGRSTAPFETNPPLVVNSDAVLALAVPSQCLKAISRKGGEISKRCSRLHTIKLQTCRPLKAGKRFYMLPGSEIFGPLVPILTIIEHSDITNR